MRLCADCGADISDRKMPAYLCLACLAKRQLEHQRRWREAHPRHKAKLSKRTKQKRRMAARKRYVKRIIVVECGSCGKTFNRRGQSRRLYHEACALLVEAYGARVRANQSNARKKAQNALR